MQLDKYLARIGYSGDAVPERQTLFELHRLHMLSVPFENLSIHLGIPIVLQLPELFEKIVNQRRGGFCYELNGLFAWLLAQIGFDVRMLAARVYDGSKPGPPFDHLALHVRLEEDWLADVGFGDSFLLPLKFDQATAVQQGIDRFKIVKQAEYILFRQRTGQVWAPQYKFERQFHDLDEFTAMCHYHQTSPESSFTQKQLCSLATGDGRITLSNNLLIVRQDEQRTEHHLEAGEEYGRVLKDKFGIELDDKLEGLLLQNASDRRDLSLQ